MTAFDKICLIIPPSAFLLDERVFMSLGILKVASALESAGVRVDVLDLSGVENYLEVVAQYAQSGSSHCYGLTATTPQLPAATQIRNAIRRLDPGAHIILGGPHATLVHAAYRSEQRRTIAGRATRAFDQLSRDFDVLVAGDGEKAIFDALAVDGPRLIDADDPQSALFLTGQELGELPFPARHLVDVDSYRYEIDGVRALSLIAQLGCPFGCGFCGGRLSPFLRRVRVRSAASVVAEMVRMHADHGVRGFMLYDDELNVNPGMVDLMGLIEKAQTNLGVEFRLRGFIKSQLFTDAQAEAMVRAGFRWILVGFESGSERILKNIQKMANRSENTRCMEIAQRHGLKVKALMSMGHPGETPATIAETRDWLLEVQPDDFDLTIITTYPGTPYFDEAMETAPGVWTYVAPGTGDRLHSSEINFHEVAEYYKGAPGEYSAYVFTDFIDATTLVTLRDRMEAEVREKLAIPFNVGVAAQRYEHSMGQTAIPSSILREARRPLEGARR